MAHATEQDARLSFRNSNGAHFHVRNEVEREREIWKRSHFLCVLVSASYTSAHPRVLCPVQCPASGNRNLIRPGEWERERERIDGNSVVCVCQNSIDTVLSLYSETSITQNAIHNSKTTYNIYLFSSIFSTHYYGMDDEEHISRNSTPLAAIPTGRQLWYF